MRKNNLVRIICSLVIIVVLFLADFQPASACSCALPGPPNEAFARATAVFRGRVTSISGGGGGGLLSELMGLVGLGGSLGFNRQVDFEVTDSWKGVERTAVTVRTGFGGGDCGFEFRRGATYLVYGFEDGGRLTTHICSRTVAVSGASAADDFTYLAGKTPLTLKAGGAGNGVVLGLAVLGGGVLAGLGVLFFVRRKNAGDGAG